MCSVRKLQRKGRNTKLKKEDLCKHLYLCTKEMQFAFNGHIFHQTDRVFNGQAFGTSFGQHYDCILRNQFGSCTLIALCRWYFHVKVPSTSFIKEESIDVIIDVLNSFHPSIDFFYPQKKTNANHF